WWFIFLWKNNSLRSGIFFRQKNKPPPHDRQIISGKSFADGCNEGEGAYPGTEVTIRSRVDVAGRAF
ncbi:hypothetical protein, partial [Marinobacter shengliensis]